MIRTLPYVIAVGFLGVSLACVPRPGRAALVSAPVRAASDPAIEPAVLVEPAKTPASHEDLFDWINFVLLVAVLVYFLRKPLGQFFMNRSRTIECGLEEGRKALEAAQAQLAAAEEKLRHLEQEIAAVTADAAREREAERERLRRASEEEGRRILEAAHNMIASATQAARLELKRAAAAESVALAERMIRDRLDEAGRARLVSRFIEGIGKN